MRRTTWGTLTIALAITVTACGGGDDDAGDILDAIQDAQDAQNESSDQQVDAPPDAPADDSDDGVVSGASPLDVPIARFTAHGPQAANTIGPACSSGIDDRGGDVFRFTPPAGWTWWGTSGGSGSDQVHIKDESDVSLYVTESAYDYDTEILTDWQVLGPAGADIVIDGVTLPIMEISLEGDSGYALVDFDYLSPMPVLTTGAALGTVALTSAEPGRPTLDEARQLLETVRVERCEATGQAMIWGPGGGARLVPRFEPDPLGKTYPEQPQPAYDPTVGTLASYTLEQVAYLMPVEADVAMCAAEKAVALEADNPIAYLLMFLPSGTNRTDLAAIVAEC